MRTHTNMDRFNPFLHTEVDQFNPLALTNLYYLQRLFGHSQVGLQHAVKSVETDDPRPEGWKWLQLPQGVKITKSKILKYCAGTSANFTLTSATPVALEFCTALSQYRNLIHNTLFTILSPIE